jgi:hypothetical protein
MERTLQKETKQTKQMTWRGRCASGQGASGNAMPRVWLEAECIAVGMRVWGNRAQDLDEAFRQA